MTEISKEAIEDFLGMEVEVTERYHAYEYTVTADHNPWDLLKEVRDRFGICGYSISHYETAFIFEEEGNIYELIVKHPEKKN